MLLVFTAFTIEVGRTRPSAYLGDDVLLLRDDVGLAVLKDIIAPYDDGILSPRFWSVHSGSMASQCSLQDIVVFLWLPDLCRATPPPIVLVTVPALLPFEVVHDAPIFRLNEGNVKQSCTGISCGSKKEQLASGKSSCMRKRHARKQPGPCTR